MNKIKLIIVVFVFIILFCFIGSFFIQADTEIEMEEDILAIQNNINNSINVYGYDFNNPVVIVDPYNENYNSALIMFETEEYTSIKINVNDVYSYNSKETNRHYIGVYNLINGSNYVVLSYDNKVKKIEIEIKEEENKIDMEDFSILSNNHILVPTDKYMEDGDYTGVREIDVLGKIYYEYLINDGYKGVACEIDEEKIAILSDKLLVLDRQNGNVISSYDISLYEYNWKWMEFINNEIVLYSDEGVISVDLNGDFTEIEGNYNKNDLSGNINYNNNMGVRFYKEVSSKKSNENIWLLNYSNDMEYEIDIKKEFNRIIVSSKDINSCNTYLVLDQLFDKRVYELCNNVNYIYTYDFDGKYSVYFKLNGKIYKTNKFLIY